MSRKKDHKKLNIKQELFCQLYVHDQNAMGNGTRCYAEAYKIDISDIYNEITKKTEINPSYNICSAESSRLLRNVKIKNRISEILNQFLKDEVVDGELAKVIRQDHKFEPKVAAIREYNKLKQRIVEKIDHTTLGKELPTPMYGSRAE